MSEQEQRDGGFFVVRGGMAIDVWHHLGFGIDKLQTDQVNAWLAKDLTPALAWGASSLRGR